jgi:hypothetical protein
MIPKRAAIKYWLKTVLYATWPGGYGYLRRLHAERNPRYNIARDKHPIRQKHNAQSGWQTTTTPLRQRAYGTYSEYTLHQQQKYFEILKVHGGRNRGGSPP